jgi:hypothetical protein
MQPLEALYQAGGGTGVVATQAPPRSRRQVAVKQRVFEEAQFFGVSTTALLTHVLVVQASDENLAVTEQIYCPVGLVALGIQL